MWITRQGKKRYFFFINDRLWKMYDEVPLAESGALGKTYLDAVNTLNGKLGAQGRVQGADAAKGINATTVDWKDGSSHLRVVDRSGEQRRRRRRWRTTARSGTSRRSAQQGRGSDRDRSRRSRR